MLRTFPRLIPSSRYISRSQSTKVPLKDLDSKWISKWQDLTSKQGLNPKKFNIPSDAQSFYALVMFPYPSGTLHMGHVRVYTISDVISRFKRLQGYNVIHPMGWDAFGLPAENAAIDRGINPSIWTDTNIAKMKQQMLSVLVDFDWEREVTTCKPDYYKWTQKIFLLLHQHNLAYKKEAEINWDPIDETVLANEQVDAQGKSWRSGAIVEKRKLSQWFIKITDFASELNNDLNILDKWPDKVKSMQKNWIGQSFGTEIKFPTNFNDKFPFLTVFTSRPDTIFSVQFLALSLSHPLVLEVAKNDTKLQEFINRAKNLPHDSKEGYLIDNIEASIPIDTNNKKSTKCNIPLYVAPYVLDSYGSGAVMGCPAHDERDYEFWKIHNPCYQPLVTVGPSKLKSGNDWELPYTNKQGILYDNSTIANGVDDLGIYKGMETKAAGKKVTESLENLGLGNGKINYRIRDWLISRQRYWGAPIPMIYCDDCGTVPVPDEDLPVLLPDIGGENFTRGNNLSKLESFKNTTCPSCGGHAIRDTDTMDTFMDSSWYFFRYLDSKNNEKPFDFDKVNKNLPVDMYIGGVEHAILHLLYTRFISKFLASIGLWDGSKLNNEPIINLVTQGMVQGKTYSDPDSGKFLKPDEVDFSDAMNPKVLSTGKTPLISFEKMSKSKYNGVDPGEIVKKYGADAVRSHILFQAPISDSLNWNEDQIQGVDRWLHKVIALSESIFHQLSKIDATNVNSYNDIILCGEKYEAITLSDNEVKLLNDTNKLIQNIDKSINVDLSFNTVISDLMKYTNALINAVKHEEKFNPELLLDVYKKLLVIMSPITPCTAEESWEKLLCKLNRPWSSIMLEKFPEIQIIESNNINYNIFINGKSRLLFQNSKDFVDLNNEVILDKLLEFESVSSFVTSRDKIKKIIKKPGMISLVVGK